MDELLIPVFIIFCLIVPAIALALLLYAVPVRATVTLVCREERREKALVISWGIIGIRYAGHGTGRITGVLIGGHTVLSRSGPPETGGGKRIPDQAPGPAGMLKTGEIIRIVQGVTGPVGSFLSAFWDECRFEDARGTVTLGLGDPVLTGEVCGYYWASRFLLQASRVYIELEPVFDRPVFGLDISMKVKVEHPIRVLMAGVELARDPAVKEAMAIAKLRAPGVAGA